MDTPSIKEIVNQLTQEYHEGHALAPVRLSDTSHFVSLSKQGYLQFYIQVSDSPNSFDEARRELEQLKLEILAIHVESSLSNWDHENLKNHTFVIITLQTTVAGPLRH